MGSEQALISQRSAVGSLGNSEKKFVLRMGPCHEKNCLWGFPQSSYPNQTAQLQILPSNLKFHLLKV